MNVEMAINELLMTPKINQLMRVTCFFEQKIIEKTEDLGVETVVLNDAKNKSLVNAHKIGVLSKRLLKRIDGLNKKFDVADALIIKITETSLNHDFDTTKKFIDTIHSYGCKISLNEFGPGFTSFKQLLNLPIDIIKIDGIHMRDVLSNNHSRFFVEALINLAEDLGIKTVVVNDTKNKSSVNVSNVGVLNKRY